MRRFYRLDRSRHLPGTGLGLSLVAAIVRLHGFGLTVGPPRGRRMRGDDPLLERSGRPEPGPISPCDAGRGLGARDDLAAQALVRRHGRLVLRVSLPVGGLWRPGRRGSRSRSRSECGDPALQRRIEAAGIRVLPSRHERGHFGPLALLGHVRGFASLFRSERPDVVHLISVRLIVLAGIAAVLTGVFRRVQAVTGLGLIGGQQHLQGEGRARRAGAAAPRAARRTFRTLRLREP